MADLPPPATEFGEPRTSVLARLAEGQVVFRVIAGEQPDLWDFQSHVHHGDAPPGDGSAILWAGLSVWDRADRAWKVVDLGMGRGVASVELAEGAVHVARTRKRRGHHTVWGEPAQLLAKAAAVARPGS